MCCQSLSVHRCFIPVVSRTQCFLIITIICNSYHLFCVLLLRFLSLGSSGGGALLKTSHLGENTPEFLTCHHFDSFPDWNTLLTSRLRVRSQVQGVLLFIPQTTACWRRPFIHLQMRRPK